jgi:hypothetical protein
MHYILSRRNTHQMSEPGSSKQTVGCMSNYEFGKHVHHQVCYLQEVLRPLETLKQGVI